MIIENSLTNQLKVDDKIFVGITYISFASLGMYGYDCKATIDGSNPVTSGYLGWISYNELTWKGHPSKFHDETC